MKTSLLIVASLALGTTAIAQDMPAGAPAQGSPPMANTPSSPSGTDTTMPSQSGMQPADPNAPSATMPDSTTPPTGDMSAQPPAGGMGTTPPPSGDMGATPPPAGDAGMGQQTASAMPTDTSNYPKCSRSVTDKCVQAGGSGRGMAHHRTTHRRPHR